MNCTEVRQHGMLYLDSEGDAELHLRIRDHLAGCTVCARWFAQQQQLEKQINGQLSAGDVSPVLWGRVLSGAGLGRHPARRKRWLAAAGVLAAAAAALVVVFVGLQVKGRSGSAELTRSAAEWHEQRIRGNVHPDFVSTSDEEVDRYLKSRVPFRVHCPPRTDVNFTVQGAGMCFVKGQRQAAYIVGRVGQAPVSILVLDRASAEMVLDQNLHRCLEGSYQVAFGAIAENVVIVIGTTPPDVLERLLNAYGSYHEG